MKKFSSFLSITTGLLLLVLQFLPYTKANEPPQWLKIISSGVSMAENGDYKGAEATFKHVLEMANQEPDRAQAAIMTMYAFGNLGQTYNEEGRYAEAELYLKKVMAFQEKVMPNSDDFSTTLNNLGLVYQNMGKYPEAEALYRRSVGIDENQGAKLNKEQYARHINNLAESLRYQKKFPEAETYDQQAIQLHLASGNEERTAIPLANLGTTYFGNGQYAKAEKALSEALAIEQKHFPSGHPYIATTYSSLGSAYSRQGKYTEAEAAFKQALGIHERGLGASHPLIAQDYNNLGIFYAESRKFNLALPAIEKALAIYKASVGIEHPHYKSTLRNYTAIKAASQGK